MVSSKNEEITKHSGSVRIPHNLLFFVCVGGIYISYLVFGICQESLTTTYYGPENEKFKDTTFTLFVQCVVNALITFILIQVQGIPNDPTPKIKYMGLSLTYIGAMYCSNAAIYYVPYPTMTLAKSCKPIPVLLMALLVYGKRQTLTKYICVLLITVGISWFMLEGAHNKGKEENNWFGIVLLIMSLAMDGITGPFQDNLISVYRPNQNHMMMYTNAWASVALAVVMVGSGTALNGFQFCIRHPEVLYDILAFSIASSIGQLFIYMTIHNFGSLVCTLVTTTRKFFTILMSVLWFGHSLSIGQWGAVGVVFFGLGLETFDSYQRKKQTKEKLEKQN